MRIQKARAAAQKIAADRWETERNRLEVDRWRGGRGTSRGVRLPESRAGAGIWSNGKPLEASTTSNLPSDREEVRRLTRSRAQARTQSGRSRGARVSGIRVQSSNAQSGPVLPVASVHRIHRRDAISGLRPVIRRPA